MFDIDKDPYQMQNLADSLEYSEVRAELTRMIQSWTIRTGDREFEGLAIEMASGGQVPV